MKIIFTLLACGFVLTSSAQAAKRCETSVEATIFKTDGSIYRNIEVSGETKVKRTKTWEDCYRYATQRAKNFQTTVPLTVSSWRINGGSADTPGYISVSWKYNDGIFFDTKGKVTKYTDEFEVGPLDADLRYFSDGTLFR